MTCRHATSRAQRHSAHSTACVPSGVVVRAWLPEPCPAATGGCGFTIETGSESAIGINLPAFMQQVTNTHVKRWKEHRHARDRVRVRPSLSRALQVFPGGNRRLLLPGRSLRGAESPACKPVERAESWRWSSLRRVEREDPAFPILSTWPLPRPTDWLQIVNQPQTEAEVAALRCCVNRGRPFGDPNWVTDTAKRLGLESTIRPRGRPKKQS